MKRAVAVVLLVPLFGCGLFGCTPIAGASESQPHLAHNRSSTTQSPTAQSPTTQASATPTPTEPTPTGPTTPTPSGNGLHQDWHFVTDEGARGTFTVPSRTNRLAQRIEAERSAAKGKRLYYLLIDVDNTKGSEAGAAGHDRVRGPGRAPHQITR